MNKLQKELHSKMLKVFPDEFRAGDMCDTKKFGIVELLIPSYFKSFWKIKNNVGIVIDEYIPLSELGLYKPNWTFLQILMAWYKIKKEKNIWKRDHAWEEFLKNYQDQIVDILKNWIPTESLFNQSAETQSVINEILE